MSAINDLIDCVESKGRLNLISTTSITRTLKNSLLAHQVKLGRRITVTLLVFNQAWAPTTSSWWMLLLEKKSIEQGGPPSEGLLKISKASLNDKLDHHVLFWDFFGFIKFLVAILHGSIKRSCNSNKVTVMLNLMSK